VEHKKITKKEIVPEKEHKVKYKAWDKIEEIISEVVHINFEEETAVLKNEAYDEDEHAKGYAIRAFNELELMQYIGLRDAKTGKEIYAGDILLCKKYVGGNFCEYSYEKGYVEFKHGAFGLHRNEGYYRPFKDWLYELEIIGNIFENPELLEDKP
jgi:uncharacterized phage protein (TIGR01671 family)